MSTPLTISFKWKDLEFEADIKYTPGTWATREDPGTDPELELVTIRHGGVDVSWMLESDFIAEDMSQVIYETTNPEDEIQRLNDDAKLDAFIANQEDF